MKFTLTPRWCEIFVEIIVIWRPKFGHLIQRNVNILGILVLATWVVTSLTVTLTCVAIIPIMTRRRVGSFIFLMDYYFTMYSTRTVVKSKWVVILGYILFYIPTQDFFSLPRLPFSSLKGWTMVLENMYLLSLNCAQHVSEKKSLFIYVTWYLWTKYRNGSMISLIY